LRNSDGVRFSSSEYANIFCILISIFYYVIINHDSRIWIYFLITRLKSKNFLTKLRFSHFDNLSKKACLACHSER
jgi:hypothetical protein